MFSLSVLVSFCVSMLCLYVCVCVRYFSFSFGPIDSSRDILSCCCWLFDYSYFMIDVYCLLLTHSVATFNLSTGFSSSCTWKDGKQLNASNRKEITRKKGLFLLLLFYVWNATDESAKSIDFLFMLCAEMWMNHEMASQNGLCELSLDLSRLDKTHYRILWFQV